jgi:hypothetical protein
MNRKVRRILDKFIPQPYTNNFTNSLTITTRADIAAFPNHSMNFRLQQTVARYFYPTPSLHTNQKSHTQEECFSYANINIVISYKI